MCQFEASIVYTDENMQRLSTSIFSTFHMEIKVIYLSISIGLMIIGAFIGLGNVFGISFICFGAFLFPFALSVDKSRAKSAIKQMNGVVLHVKYEFWDDYFACSNGKERNQFSYRSIIRLLNEKDFFYLFPNKTQAYMIDKSTLSPAKEEKFKKFISDKAGLQWTSPVSLISFNRRQWKFNRENTRS